MPEKKDSLTKEIDEVVRAAQREIIEKNRATHRRLIEFGFRAGYRLKEAQMKHVRADRSSPDIRVGGDGESKYW